MLFRVDCANPCREKAQLTGVCTEGFQRAIADFVRFHCPLEPAEKTDIIGKDSRIPCAHRSRGGFSLPQNDKKTPLTLANQGLIGIRQRLILPGRVQPSTFSTGELNFCVRDGNRWNLSVIATGNCGYLVASPFSSCFHFTYLRLKEKGRS